MSLFRAGSVVVTPDGVGVVQAVMGKRDRYGRWIWGAFRFERGPYLVLLPGGTLAAYAADDLSDDQALRAVRVDPRRLRDIVGE